MIEIRPHRQLGGADHDWLRTRHHFSFADYHDPERMGWGALRVWNDDDIAPHSGFPPHPHRDMEVITYVRSGAITHEDSLGNRGRTAAGDVQVMSAGTGILHAEYNREAEPTTLFQIWIRPEQRGVAPSWGTRPFPRGERAGAFVTLASGEPGESDGDSGPLRIRANARVAAATLPAGCRVEYPIGLGRRVYLVPASGRIAVNGVIAEAGDGVAIADELRLRITALADGEVVLVEVG